MSKIQIPFSDHDLLDGPEFNSDIPEYKSEDNGSKNDIQYQRTLDKSYSAISPSSFF